MNQQTELRSCEPVRLERRNVSSLLPRRRIGTARTVKHGTFGRRVLSCGQVLLVGLLLRGTALAIEPADLAKQIVNQTGVSGGMALHLGCGDGELTAALRFDGRFTVQGLDGDAEKVAQTRASIRAAGNYGSVSVAQQTARTLPFADNLVNLVVVDDPDLVPMPEVMRVLAPGGVACWRDAGTLRTARKTRPPEIDEWSHYLHDATNNAVAQDELVGPPRGVHWLAPPLWLRSHETPSGIEAPICAGGRLFYIFDEGLIGVTDPRLPARWSIICRDAFNGKLLWKHRLGPWGWREWNRQKYEGTDWTRLRAARTDVPLDNNRRLVADAQHLYATLSFDGPLSILDARTGARLTDVAGTDHTREILVSDGVCVALTRAVESSAARRRGQPTPADTKLVAVDTKTLRTKWSQAVPAVGQLLWAIDRGQIVLWASGKLVSYDLATGDRKWIHAGGKVKPKTLVCADGVVVLLQPKAVAAHALADGAQLWQHEVRPIGGGEAVDLFVVDGVVWRGMSMVDDDGKPGRKTPNVKDVGWDLHSGKQVKELFVRNLRSPEHHHRCYRNVATTRYLISSYEGAEFLDFQDENHAQNNWIRGACKAGMLPSNGMLYVPPDQCFCNPASKILGYAAFTARSADAASAAHDQPRLVTGPAYESAMTAVPLTGADWPTFRHDSARHGSTAAPIVGQVREQWRLQLDGPLSAPVVAGAHVYVAQIDAHTVTAVRRADHTVAWQFTAEGRIDSPPTVYQGRVLFGARDGYVYCLRADDGVLAWRFRAAPIDRRIAVFDQFESVWPVFGSVLIDHDLAYVTAGRSTYLDGGIRVYALDPATGAVVHQCTLEGPFPKVPDTRDYGFYSPGALADVLVAEGGFVYMRQKKLTPELRAVELPDLSSKGAQDVGMHLFSTAGLLDGSWYNRTFWMYSKRWPGFQLANQAPKTGQLLVVDDKSTFAVRMFYHRNVHSPMFFPGEKGYLLFADANTTEPQIVGEAGARPPLRWLPQSDYSRARGNEMRALDSPAFGLDKMIGYTRADPPLWMQWIDVRMRAMVKAGDRLFVAGPPDVLDPKDPYAAFEGRAGAKLVAVSAGDGRELQRVDLQHPPVFDGMIAAHGRIFVALENGELVCFGP